jgi:hypothetical protein
MAEPAQLALIHAEIDGEISDLQRAELARAVLADPQLRALRDDLRQLCTTLETMDVAEPPAGLHAAILAALPQATPKPAASQWSPARLRYAAMVAGALATGTVVYSVIEGQGPATRETVGTLSASRAATTLDAVQLTDGELRGRVSLTREGSEFGLAFELVANDPVDVVVEADGQTLRLDGVGGAPQTVPLPGIRAAGQVVNLTFLLAGREVGRATLHPTATR